MNMKNIEKLKEYTNDPIVVFDNLDYDSALIGITEDNRAVYDYDLMIKYLMDTQGWDETESIEWIEYNTLRALPYVQGSPIIMYRFD